ncbi:YrzQ family protein [Fictibacillus phosphorivorans]|uniref:YrzQ family protein n=1 Tax=Fictibacillus phosphorivorans TaxID=1221500 RepID=UPI003CF48B90
MSRTMSSLFGLGIGAATYAMRNKRMSRMSKMNYNLSDLSDLWTSRRVKKIRKKVAKAIY